MAKRYTVVGLDIGRHSVKAAWAERRGGQAAVTRAEILRLPLDASDALAMVAPWVEKLQLSRFPCVIGLPGHQCMFQPLAMPPGDPRKPEEAAAMEMVKFNDMASEPMAYAFAPFSLNPGEQRLLLAMTRVAVLDQALDNARQLQLDVIDVIPSPVALFNAVGLDPGAEDPTLVLNVGHGSTDAVIGSAAGLLFARSFAGGGRLFTDALARSEKLSVAQAENLKVTQGNLAEGSASAQPLRSAADVWAGEVVSCLSVYQSVYPERKARPRRVRLAGGAARLPGLCEYLAEKLKMEVARVDSLPSTATDVEAAGFSVAAGLAFTALNPSVVRVSLLPARLRDELTFRVQKPYWVGAAVAAGLILAVMLVGGFKDFRRMEKKLNAQRMDLRRRQGLAAEIEAAKTENEQIARMAGQVASLIDVGPRVRDLLKLLGDSLGEGDGLTMVCDAESYFPKAKESNVPTRYRESGESGAAAAESPDAAPAAGAAGFRRVIVEGCTRGNSLASVKDLIRNLNEADFVASADLLGDDQVAPESRARLQALESQGRSFVIDVKLKGVGGEGSGAEPRAAGPPAEAAPEGEGESPEDVPESDS